MKIFRSGLALLLLVALPAWAAPGVMLRDDTLRNAPSATAAAVGSVTKGQAVEVLGRQSGWSRVQAQGKTGWVRLLSVRGGAVAQTDVGGELAGVLALGGTRRDPGKVVAVAGVRGLSEEELKQARYDARQLERLEGYAVTLPEANRFAAEAGLARREVAYLPAPQSASGSGETWGGNQP
ncbi:MAG: SH3 domain-containing protein [Hydrogenophilaceae bacterium]|nr:SH3 domain-containing protein [Hydrogenophilaceae bacterium]